MSATGTPIDAWKSRARRLREVAQAPELRGGEIGRLDLAAVRAFLDLPEPRYASLAGQHCWLAGGSLLRWLADEPCVGGDYDFYFSTREALYKLASQLAASGCVVRRASRPLTNGAHLKRKVLSRLNRWRGLPRPGAPPAYEKWDAPEALAWLNETARAPWLLVIEFLTPADDLVQLVGGIIEPTPEDLLATFDYSICQLAIDDRHLYAGRRTLVDLADRRLRLERVGYPPLTLRRLIKYARRGYRPDARTVVALARALRDGGSRLTKKGAGAGHQ